MSRLFNTNQCAKQVFKCVLTGVCSRGCSYMPPKLQAGKYAPLRFCNGLFLSFFKLDFILKRVFKFFGISSGKFQILAPRENRDPLYNPCRRKNGSSWGGIPCPLSSELYQLPQDSPRVPLGFKSSAPSRLPPPPELSDNKEYAPQLPLFYGTGKTHFLPPSKWVGVSPLKNSPCI